MEVVGKSCLTVYELEEYLKCDLNMPSEFYTNASVKILRRFHVLSSPNKNLQNSFRRKVFTFGLDSSFDCNWKASLNVKLRLLNLQLGELTCKFENPIKFQKQINSILNDLKLVQRSKLKKFCLGGIQII